MRNRFGSLNAGRQKILRERLIYMGGGMLVFLMAIVVAVVVYSYNEVEAHQTLAVTEQPAEQVYFGTVVLLAPTSPVPHGTRLSNVDLREIHWPRNEVPEGAVRRANDVQDMYAKVDLPANQPILRANLSPTPLLGGVADLIPPGHRATTIEVDSTAGVEGWAKPGAHVDVIVTFHDSTDGQKKSQIVVEDAVVVSFNGQTQKATGAPGTPQAVGRMASSATVTLAVPVVDAVKIHTAIAMGRITLILRNLSDGRSVGTIGVTTKDITQDRGAAKPDKSETTGFVSFTDENGSRRELELREDKRWWNIESDF